MMNDAERNQDALQLEALLVSRRYLYTLFHKLTGGTPDTDLVSLLLGETTADCLDEFSAHSETLVGFKKFLAEIAGFDRGYLIDSIKDEYTRIFVGPAALPASPYESPYTGTHDMTVFQENTIQVRKLYAAEGLEPKRLMAVPDDHISLMCAFQAEMASRSLELLRAGDAAALAATLRTQGMFVEQHMANWLGTFAKSVRNAKAGRLAVLYPQLLEAMTAFAKADVDFLVETAFWAESQEALAPTEPAPELAEAEAQQAKLAGIHPFGIRDNELVSLV